TKFCDYVVIAEWVSATRHFNSFNLSYDDHGAKPIVFHIEGAWHFNLTPCKPATFILGYDHTYQSIEFVLTKHRYLVGLNVNVLRRVLAAVELRYDRNYAKGHSGTGDDLPENARNVLGRSATRIATLLQYEF